MIFKQWMYKAAPTILAITSCAGVVFTAYQSAKDTPKALERLKKAEEEKGEELTTMEKIATAAPCYIRTGAAVATTCGMMLTSDAMSRSQKAKLAATIVAAEQTAQRVAKKTDELYGEGASDNVKYELLKEDYEKLKNDYEHKGEQTFYLRGYGFFTSTEKDIWNAYANFIRKFDWDGVVSLADFVGFINKVPEYPYPDATLGNIGWHADYLAEEFGHWDICMNIVEDDKFPGVGILRFDQPALVNLIDFQDSYDYSNHDSDIWKTVEIGAPDEPHQKQGL